MSETPTVVETRGHAVRYVWAGATISMSCWCGWDAHITDPAADDTAALARQYTAAATVATGHEQPADVALPDDLAALLAFRPRIVGGVA